jgi:hypothetical protein
MTILSVGKRFAGMKSRLTFSTSNRMHCALPAMLGRQGVQTVKEDDPLGNRNSTGMQRVTVIDREANCGLCRDIVTW